MKDPTIHKEILIRWVVIGILAFLFVLFLFLNVMFGGETKNTPEEEVFKPEGILEEQMEYPTYDFNSELPELSESESLDLKEQVWNSILAYDLDYAISLMDKAYSESNFSDNQEMIALYSDVNLLGVIGQVPVTEQSSILSSFSTPRFQAIFPVFTSVLTLATIVQDEDSLLPVDVKSVQLITEEILEVYECEGVSPYMDSILRHFKEVYRAKASFNGNTLDVYVGIFHSGRLKLIGYYGESNDLRTDAFWEENRYEFSQVPVFQ